MGNNKSAPSLDDPYKMLGVDRSASKKEIRRKYTELLLQYHPTRNKSSSDEKVIQIKEAYRSIVENRPWETSVAVQINLDAYTEDYFGGLGREFYSTVSNLFEMLCEKEPVANYPKFGDASSKNFESFYGFFRKFRTQRMLSRNKAENKALQKDFNTKIRKVVDFISRSDARLKTVISERSVSEDYAVKQKRKRNKRKDTEFKCLLCKKGFRSKNQALKHLESKRHLEKVASVAEDCESYIKKEMEALLMCAESSDEGEASASSSVEEPSERVIQENEKVLQALYEKVSQMSVEDHEDDPQDAVPDESPETRPREAQSIERRTCHKRPANEKKKGKPQRKTKKKMCENFVSNESVHFLTCAACKRKFESRNQLFVHLREEKHSKP